LQGFLGRVRRLLCNKWICVVSVVGRCLHSMQEGKGWPTAMAFTSPRSHDQHSIVREKLGILIMCVRGVRDLVEVLEVTDDALVHGRVGWVLWFIWRCHDRLVFFYKLEKLNTERLPIW
jgi:hypothetical protein